MKNQDQLEGRVHPMLVPQKYPKGEMSGEVDYTEGKDVTEQHSAIAREHPEPVLSMPGVATEPVFPIWLLVLCGIAAFWAGGYLFLFSGAFRGDVFNERRWEPAMLFPAPAGGAGATAAAQQKTPAQLGEIYFKQNCASCHQATGQGAPGQFPPLAGSEWVKGNDKRLAAIVLHGLVGPITINGQKQTYSGAMAPWGGTLTDQKIANILTFIRQAWGNQASPVTAGQVAAARAAFPGRSKTMTEEELLAIPETDTLPAGGEAAPANGATPGS